MTPQMLMVVLAHPDDESFPVGGTLATAWKLIYSPESTTQNRKNHLGVFINVNNRTNHHL